MSMTQTQAFQLITKKVSDALAEIFQGVDEERQKHFDDLERALDAGRQLQKQLNKLQQELTPTPMSGEVYAPSVRTLVGLLNYAYWNHGIAVSMGVQTERCNSGRFIAAFIDPVLLREEASTSDRRYAIGNGDSCASAVEALVARIAGKCCYFSSGGRSVLIAVPPDLRAA